MSGFTDEICTFLASQRIALSDVYDASHLGSRQYKRAMERAGKQFAIVKNPCYRGHYLRSHKGHCIQCDTSRIAFVKRYRAKAYVDVVGSRRHRVFKIGYSETPWDRASHLNSIGYGNISDWHLVYHATFPEAGKAEFDVHGALSCYEVPRPWFREGVPQTAREIFACPFAIVRKTLHDVSDNSLTSEWVSPYAESLYAFEAEEKDPL